MNKPLSQNQSIHFIGIGGIGMSALAMLLANRGFNISGSDIKRSQITENLKNSGILVFKEQISTNINTICNKTTQNPLIIISSAISEKNPELQAAKQENLIIWHRSDLLAALLIDQKSIAITGTHGKTTTSTMIATLLYECKEDPSVIVGGIVPCLNSNHHSGAGDWLIAEADESDGTLVKLRSNLGIITNLELEHADHYSNLNELIKTVKIFQTQCKQTLANYDCPNLRQHIKATKWWSIKTSKEVDFAALPISIKGNLTIADLYEGGEFIERIELKIPGLHNLSNLISAISACRVAGVSYKKIIEGIKSIKQPKRRFEFKGLWEGRYIVDDYAHHPSEVEATLDMAKLMINTKDSIFPGYLRRIVMVFQPHRYSRLKEFMQDFAIAIGQADLIILAPVFNAGEKPIEKISSIELAKLIKSIYPSIEIFTGNTLLETTQLIKTHSKKDDLILTMGAGDVTNIWHLLEKEKKDLCHENLAV